jgi:phosphoribosyl 1,2-cyclic phosphate phosphodiesterase
MNLTLLGTGDAIGTPKVGCSCPQCTRAATTGTMRLRTSLLIKNGGRHILIDSSPDLRQQLLLNGSPSIDAVLWTHGHYDHFIGYGEFYRVQDLPPVYAAPPVLTYCAELFRFLSFDQHAVKPYEPFELFGCSITPLIVKHPPAYTCGMLIECNGARIGFTSDTNADIPKKSLDLLRGLDLLLVDALVPSDIRVHKHMNYLEACTLAQDLSPADFRCIHTSHLIPWDLPRIGMDGEIFAF